MLRVLQKLKYYCSEKYVEDAKQKRKINHG